MPIIVEVTGPDIYPFGGATPDEQYGVSVYGPAIFGAANSTGLSDELASTFPNEDMARCMMLALKFASPNNSFRYRSVP